MMKNSPINALLQEAEENTIIRRMYAKPKCKTCKGTGQIIRSLREEDVITGQSTWVTRTYICDCIPIAIKRELKGG